MCSLNDRAMNLYSNILVPHLMVYFREARVTYEWNFCLGIPFNYTGLKNESSWVDELSFDRCMEKSDVETETCFSSHEGRKYIRAYTHTHFAVYELLGSLDIDFLNFWASCLSYVGCFWLWAASFILPNVPHRSGNL